MNKIKILLVDDHDLVRIGIRSYLEMESGRFEVIGEASNGISAMAEIKVNKPDIIIMDINMPQMDGIKATKEVKKRYPEMKILALSMLSESQHIKAMITAGADGYILKNTSPDQLFEAIEKVCDNETYYSFDVSQKILSSFSKKKKSLSKYENTQLTAREKEVLYLIMKEYSNMEIAEKLYISTRTVDAHKRNLIEKTGVKNLVALVNYVHEKRLFEDI
ncbi:MAG: response regulator transcription factor [Flavobacteriales bacterium]|nr:response regulator transcription factor [Flavobacteriales bacterium]